MSCVPQPQRDTYEFEFLGRMVGNGPANANGSPGRRNRTLIIAEIGVNHGGDEDLAAMMIGEAAKTGVDVVKFQLRDLAACYGKLAEPGGEHAAPGALAAYMPILRKVALSVEALAKLKTVAESAGVGFLVTPFDEPSVAALETIGVGAYKIGSCDAVNPWVLDAVVATGKPFIVSTGMCTEAEVWWLVSYLHGVGATGRFALMHAVSSYPTAFADCQLHLIQRYRYNHGCPVGWSGHERGVAVSVTAAAMGADVIERHFTLDRTLPGPDQAASLEPDGMKKLVARVRAFEEAYGDPVADRRRPRGEYVSEEVLRKSLHVRNDIPAGMPITRADVVAIGPGRGLSPRSIFRIEGRGNVAARALTAGDALKPADLAPRVTTTTSEGVIAAPARAQEAGQGVQRADGPGDTAGVAA